MCLRKSYYYIPAWNYLQIICVLSTVLVLRMIGLHYATLAAYRLGLCSIAIMIAIYRSVAPAITVDH